MAVIVITDSSRQLLAARSPTGRLSNEHATRLPGGRWSVVVDDATANALASVDPDFDVAIRIMCTTGVGHA